MGKANKRAGTTLGHILYFDGDRLSQFAESVGYKPGKSKSLLKVFIGLPFMKGLSIGPGVEFRNETSAETSKLELVRELITRCEKRGLLKRDRPIRGRSEPEDTLFLEPLSATQFIYYDEKLKERHGLAHFSIWVAEPICLGEPRLFLAETYWEDDRRNSPYSGLKALKYLAQQMGTDVSRVVSNDPLKCLESLGGERHDPRNIWSLYHVRQRFPDGIVGYPVFVAATVGD